VDLILRQAQDEGHGEASAFENLILSLSKDEVFAPTRWSWSERLNSAISPKIILPQLQTNEAPSNNPAI
jgi:hypothetical protein